MGERVYTEIEGIKVKNVPVVKEFTYEDDDNTSQNNRDNLEKSIIDIIVHYFKNN